MNDEQKDWAVHYTDTGIKDQWRAFPTFNSEKTQLKRAIAGMAGMSPKHSARLEVEWTSMNIYGETEIYLEIPDSETSMACMSLLRLELFFWRGSWTHNNKPQFPVETTSTGDYTWPAESPLPFVPLINIFS